MIQITAKIFFLTFIVLGVKSDDPDCPAIDGETPTYFPHEDCTKFYECFRGTAWEMNCSPGLYFNPTLLVCDTPEHSGCKGNTPAPPKVRRPVSTLEEAPDCPAIDGDTPTYFPHEDCTKFYECFRGTAWEQSCAPGLYFNPTLFVCDTPEHAGCKGITPTPLKVRHIVSNLEEAPECPIIDGETPTYFPHEDCTKFYECFRGTAWEIDCPAGLYFNPTLLVCDTPEHAGCKGNTPTPPKVGRPVLTLEKAPECPTIDGDTPTYYPHEDCTKFYECFRGIAWEQNCASGLFFNPTLLVCDTPEHAGCKENTPAPFKLRHPVANLEKAPDCPAIDGETPTYIPHEDCTKFYECFRGTAWVLDCPAGLYFNPTLFVCDTPEHAGCKGNTPAPPKMRHPVSNLEKAPDCPAIDGDTPTYFPHDDCTKFYECFRGTAWVLDCPAGLYFNPTLFVCDTPEHAGCKGNTPAPPKVRHPVSNLEKTPDCPAIDGDTPTYFPHDDCTKFYECFRGTAWVLDCPAGLYFNPTLFVCDTPEHAGCKGNTPAPPKVRHPVSNLEKAPDCPAIDGDTPTYFPHEDCTKFYECFRGTAWVLDCPAGLYFNPTLFVCDTPEHAGCKGNTPAPPKVRHPVSNLEKTPDCPAIDGDTPTYFPHDDCTKFYECFRGTAWVLDCPAGLYFNPTLFVCDTPEHAGCKGNTPAPPKVRHPVSNLEKTPDCPAIDGDTPTYFPHEDCTKFYECFRGTAWVLDCPAGLYFNPTLFVCDTPEHAGCKGNTPAPLKIQSHLEGTPVCPAIDGNTPTYFPHEDCTKFYECSAGNASEFTCPSGLYFNPILFVCDTPKHSGCKNQSQ